MNSLRQATGCGFSVGFAGFQINDNHRRSRGNVGIPAGISKGCGKGGKPASWLSMLSIPRHSMACFCCVRVSTFEWVDFRPRVRIFYTA